MSRAVSMLLLNALLDDYSLVRRLAAGNGPGRERGRAVAGAARVTAGSGGCAPSPVVGRRVIAADRWNAALGGAVAQPDLPVLIHGAAAKALAAYRSASASASTSAGAGAGPTVNTTRRASADPSAGPSGTGPTTVGIDIAEDRARHCVESVHKSLVHLTDVPRSVQVAVGLPLEPGWRDALSLIMARGRSVRFAICGVDAPDAPALVDALRTAVAERCAFSWSCGDWQPVTDPWSGPRPGILNVLLATAEATRGAGAKTVADQLSRTDHVDIVDAVCDLDDATAAQIRTLLDGFAVPRVPPVVDALCALDLLPKAG
ncbi:MAG: hypothetical protein ACRDVE_10670 [Actinocrinis sp.]